MRYTLTAIALAFLAGCALSPAELRGQGVRVDMRSAKAPRDAAHCIAKTMEEHRPFMDATLGSDLREGSAAGHYEVRGGGTASPVIIADVAPSGTGSHAVLYEGPYLAWRGTAAMLARACQ